MLGRKISAYQIVDTLGSGSLGVTYRARNLNLERDAVLKVLPDAITQDPQRFERARSEIRAAAGLNHPNIAAIYEMFREDNQWFIILELLQGQTLQEMLAESTFDAPRVSESTRAPLSFAWYFEYAQHLLKAIEYGHAQGLVHQGLKPANIFITHPGVLKVMDFGLAGLPVSASSAASDGPMNAGATAPTLEGGSSPTKAEPHRYAGWAAYRSPEQVRGEKLDERSDLFSLGAVLYEMATGRPPFAGESSAAALAAVLDQKPRRPIEVTYEVPEELDRIMCKALEKDPGARYQHAGEVRKDVERLLDRTQSWRRGPIVR